MFTETATVRPVPEPRDIDQADADEINAALDDREASQERVEKAVAQALLHGASIRAVRDATGLSDNTIMKYGRAHGWPTRENRAGFNRSKYDPPKRGGR